MATITYSREVIYKTVCMEVIFSRDSKSEDGASLIDISVGGVSISPLISEDMQDDILDESVRLWALDLFDSRVDAKIDDSKYAHDYEHGERIAYEDSLWR